VIVVLPARGERRIAAGGSYQSLDQGERYQVERIVVKQGGRLSLQIRQHRIRGGDDDQFSAPSRATSCFSVAT
jgi:hypothetical protein